MTIILTVGVTIKVAHNGRTILTEQVHILFVTRRQVKLRTIIINWWNMTHNVNLVTCLLAIVLQLRCQPLHFNGTRAWGAATVRDSRVTVEEEHRVQVDDGQSTRNNILNKVTTRGKCRSQIETKRLPYRLKLLVDGVIDDKIISIQRIVVTDSRDLSLNCKYLFLKLNKERSEI